MKKLELIVLTLVFAAFPFVDRTLAQQSGRDPTSERHPERRADAEGRKRAKRVKRVPRATPQAVEQIVVSGYRGSLHQSARNKFAAEQIVDAVFAQDANKLPDSNVAEALQRVTGIQTGRGEYGEGQRLSVRGVENNRIEIDGQSLVGTGSGRGVNFNDLPADLFESLEVIKSPTADMVEGSLGATVRLNMAGPLGSRKQYTASGNLELAQIDEISGVHPRGSLTGGYSWRETPLGDLGLTLSASHSRRRLFNSAFGTWKWQRISKPGSSYTLDGNGNGIPGEVVIGPDGKETYPDWYYKPARLAINARQAKRIQSGLNTMLQWRPTPQWEVRLRGNHTRFHDETAGVQANMNVNYDQSTADPGVQLFSANRSLLVGRQIGVPFLLQTAPNQNLSGRTSSTVGLQSEYRTGRLLASAILSHGRGRSDTRGYHFRNMYNGGTAVMDFDFSQGYGIPVMALDQIRPSDLLDPANYILDSSRHGATWGLWESSVHTAENAAHLDLDYELDWGWLRQLEMGARYADRSAWREVRKPGSTIMGALPPQEVARVLRPQPFGRLARDLPGATGGLPSDFLTTMGMRFEEYTQLLETYAGFRYPDDMLPQPSEDYYIKERTVAGYAKLNFWGDLLGTTPVTANAGVRVVTTGLRSEGVVQRADMPGLEYRDERRGYTNALASANLKIVLLEEGLEPGDNDLQLRLAVADVMARPAISQYSSSIVVNPMPEPGDVLRGSGGNPDLMPHQARQYDTSLEWYFGQGNLLSVAGFYKDIKASILREHRMEDVPGIGPILIRRPYNGPGTSVTGFEFSAQQHFAFLPDPLDGFGVNLNYTLAFDAEGSLDDEGDAVPLQGLSRHTYNAILYYEKYGLGVRGAFNYRSDYVRTTRSNNGLPNYIAGVARLDLSAFVQVHAKGRLTLSAVNLTDASRREFNKYRERLVTLSNSSRVITLGLRFDL